MKSVNNSVIIKGNNYGIIVVLSPDISFEELKEQVTEKFRESSKFFKKAKMAISFEGRTLSNDEQREILNIIESNTDMQIVCIIEDDPKKKRSCLKRPLNKSLWSLENNTGQFYKGILRSGASLEFDNSVVIIGDVNNGARVVSKGNIIVLGLRVLHTRGSIREHQFFVVALDMRPTQIRIADTIARSPDKPFEG